MFAALVVAYVRPAWADARPTLDGLVRAHAETGIALSIGTPTPERDLAASDAKIMLGLEFLGLTPLLGISTRTASFEPRFEGEFRLYTDLGKGREGSRPYLFLGFEIGTTDFDSKAPDGRTTSESIRSNGFDLGFGMEYQFESGFAVGGALGPFIAMWDSTVDRSGTRVATSGASFGVSSSFYLAWAR